MTISAKITYSGEEPGKVLGASDDLFHQYPGYGFLS